MQAKGPWNGHASIVGIGYRFPQFDLGGLHVPGTKA